MCSPILTFLTNPFSFALKIIMMQKHYYFLFLLCCVLSCFACSYKTSIYLINNTGNTIELEYILEETNPPNAIFHREQLLTYQTNARNIINFGASNLIEDLNTIPNTIQTNLLPQRALEIGALWNSTYQGTDMDGFNLINITIEINDSIINIDRDNFDAFFNQTIDGLTCIVE